MSLHLLTQVLVLGLMAWATSTVAAPQKTTQSFSAEDLSFFAKEVRPILQNNCALCHDSGKHTSGLSVESRESVLAGGNRGPAAEPGKPEQSRLIQAIRFNSELKMPPTGKLRRQGYCGSGALGGLGAACAIIDGSPERILSGKCHPLVLSTHSEAVGT